jgi:hypothetical protein
MGLLGHLSPPLSGEKSVPGIFWESLELCDSAFHPDLLSAIQGPSPAGAPFRDEGGFIFKFSWIIDRLKRLPCPD